MAPAVSPSDCDSTISGAIREWQRLLHEAPPDLSAVMAWQEQHHLYLTGPLCTVLRPNFVTHAQMEADRCAAEGVFAALRHVGDCVVADPALRDRFVGAYWEQFAEFLELESGHTHRCTSARLDAYPTRAGLTFLELNTDPGGRIYMDLETQLFESLDVFKRFAQKFNVEALGQQQHAKQALLAAYRDWGGRGLPTFVALRPPVATTSKDLQTQIGLVQAWYAAEGIRWLAVEPHELTFEGGKLRHGSTTVDLLQRTVLGGLLKAGRPALHPMLSAIRAGAVCLANPFDVYGHKGLFAALTDPAYDFKLTKETRRLVRTHVPWTRVVREQKTTDPHEMDIDLLPWAIENRAQLVLKPTDGFGGKGVVLGWQMDALGWEQQLFRCQTGKASHIVQLRVTPLKETWPALAPGMPDRVLMADRSTLFSSGRMTGYLVRLSDTDIVNVALGGSMAPTFVISPKSREDTAR